MDITSIVGYSASLVLIISFILKDMTRLRMVNSLGCALFVTYGILLDMNWPFIIPNVFIIGVNVYHLIKSLKSKTS